MSKLGLAITLFTIWMLLMYVASQVTDGEIPFILGFVSSILITIGIAVFIIGEEEQK